MYTHSLSSWVQFPMKLGIGPDKLLPSILLQKMQRIILRFNRDMKVKNEKKEQMYQFVTHKSVRFRSSPNVSGMVPVKLFAERSLQNLYKLIKKRLTEIKTNSWCTEKWMMKIDYIHKTKMARMKESYSLLKLLKFPRLGGSGPSSWLHSKTL